MASKNYTSFYHGTVLKIYRGFLEASWTHLDIPVEADSGHEDPLQVLKGHRPVLFLVDEEGE